MSNRNPFRIRTSERIDSDDTFLRLFGPDALDLIEDKSGIFEKIQLFCSSPGAGKTSLLRIFTPSVLTSLCDAAKSNEDFYEVFKRLKNMGVVGEHNPNCLGVMLSLARNYAKLEDVASDPHRSERLLYALLNARLVLVALRGILTIRRLVYPQDLHRVTILSPAHNELPSFIPIPANGEQLASWAKHVERSVGQAIDNLGVVSDRNIEGHDTLYSLQILSPDKILCDGRPVVARTLVMLDDLHELTEFQRDGLYQALTKLRPPVGVWMAQRIEALSPENMFRGATEGREYEETIFLEDFWNSNSKFQKVINSIADRRARSAHEVQISSFSGKLISSLRDSNSDQFYDKVAQDIQTRISRSVGGTLRYTEWFDSQNRAEMDAYDNAIAWRIMEIAIERDRRDVQLTLDLGLPLPPEDLKLNDSTLRAAATFLVADEFDTPYYFGSERLSILASRNIDQFLSFAGDLFEEILAGELRSGQSALTPERQQSILKDAAKRRWQDILRRIENGRDVQNFLRAIYECAKWEMDKGTASYGAGGAATGIAIQMSDRDSLVDPTISERRPEIRRLVLTLSSCIANNLLDPFMDRQQGNKEKKWMVLYLNRWLCLHFGLPLQLGGWRPKAPVELCNWLENGFVAPAKKKTNARDDT